MKKNQKQKIDTQDFIKLLSQMTKEEMYEYIKNNGKPPKLMKVYRILAPIEGQN